MQVKLEPNDEIDVSALMDCESVFREELFGNNIDTSETSSDDDFLNRLTKVSYVAQSPSYSNNCFERKSISSSSTCSDSSNSGYNFSDYQSSLLLGLEDGTNNWLKLEDGEYKSEPYSPEMEFLSENSADKMDALDFLSSDDNFSPNSIISSIPETPPITPPEGFLRQDQSPPHTPPSGTFPALVHSPPLPSSSSILASSSSMLAISSPSSSATSIVKIPKRSPDTRPTIVSTVKKKIHLAPKVQPIKVVTIKTNGAEMPHVSTISSATASTPTKTFTLIPNTSANLVTVPSSVSPTAKVVTCPIAPQNNPPTLPPIAPAVNPSSKGNLLDIRALKRQQRMIKNRESASASRKRKKMYLQSLEDENTTLKEENTKLRERISFLEKENLSLKTLKRPSVTRTSTALLGVAFLFVFNFSVIGFSRSPSLQNFPKDDNGPLSPGNALQNPPSLSGLDSVPRRSLLWLSSPAETPKESSLHNVTHICPLYINASETQRIEEELRDWFEPKPKSKSNAKRKYQKQFHPKTRKAREFALAAKAEEKEEEKLFLDNFLVNKVLTAPQAIKEASLASPTQNYKYLYHHTDDSSTIPSLENQESLLNMLGNFKRRDDTYYVVSLFEDHILLPALSKNTNVTRPRMSLLISPPNSMMNHSKSDNPLQVDFMQIDCEVTHTQVVQVARNAIPSHLLHLKEKENAQPISKDTNVTQSLLKEQVEPRRNRKLKNRGTF